MSAPNDPCRRLLLSEVLLEEYESLDQPHLASTEQENIQQAISIVVRAEQFEEDRQKVSVIYSDLAQSYETLFYSKMSAAFKQNFPAGSEKTESKAERERRERAIERLNEIRDRMIDIYAHAISLAADDPNQAKKKAAWKKALTSLYRSRWVAPEGGGGPDPKEEIDLDKIVGEIREDALQLKEHLSRAAEALHGDIVTKIYRLMAESQKDDAGKKCEEKLGEWKKKLTNVKVKSQATKDATEVDFERAAVADILGRVDDLHLKHEEEQVRIAAETNQQEKKVETTDSVNKIVLDDVVPKKGEAPEWEAGVGTGSGKAKPVEEVTLADAEKKLAQTYRSALCLSGGGIRSAVFNLGILQGLARHRLLEKFDYLSTVSGGGFSGGWLSAWIYREGLTSVINQLREPPNSTLRPEPAPLEHFRLYSNYLSPQPGLLSADTWTLVASLLRNLILNWMVFLPVLVTLLMAPRLWTAILFRSSLHAGAAESGSLVVALLAAWVSFTFIGWNLPRTNSYQANPAVEGYKSDQGPFIFWCLLPMTISAGAFAVYFRVRLVTPQGLLRTDRLELLDYIGLSIAVILVPWIICILKLSRAHFHPDNKSRNPHPVLTIVCASLLMLLAQLVTGYLLQSLVTGILLQKPGKDLFYATFAVPLILLFMSLAGTLISGFTSRLTGDQDQEWWARSGGWLLIVVVSWSAIHLLVLYGPTMFLALGQTYKNIASSGIRNLPWRDIGKIAATVVGVISGIITLLGGFSAKTPANAKEAEKAGIGGLLLSALTVIAAPIFLAFVFILLALGTDWLLTVRGTHLCSWSLTKPGCDWLSVAQVPARNISYYWHTSLLRETPFRYLLLFTLTLIVLIVVIGRLISTNNFSLQSMWRNRIIRACLGASRKPGTRRPNPFTGFDTYDNVLMHELRPQPKGFHTDPLLGRPVEDWPAWRNGQGPAPQKLMHVLNLALNLTGGKKLQWQDRKAESFTVSPLHAGSYWLGYRRSFCYGGAEGISLGAAIAISGAFASPNMGFMMTSAVVRFIMALFNFRFGTWLGNPGTAGEKSNLLERLANWPLKKFPTLTREKDLRPFRVRSPSLSVLPIVSEAFGSIDDESSYVYLSDGGHFENLGLYEMVLRRCRFIVVSDASSDAEYSFQSLAMAVRQIRIDLGVPIQIPDFMVGQPAQDLKNKYCAIGTIRYSCVDRDPDKPELSDEDYDGVLIYIKPSLIGEEPRDVINYWQGSRGFPQETITDQWFSEAQFESYRALGSHIIDVLCDPENAEQRNPVTFAAFARKVFEHNQLDFRAFREKLGYFALENQSTATMIGNEYPVFQNKVKKFLDKLLG